MMKLISKLPQFALYPIDWYVAATDWIEDNPHKTFWIGWVALVVAWCL